MDDKFAAVRAVRRALQNQYALIEHLEADSGATVSSSSSDADSVRASRTLLQDPYAHLDDSGTYDTADDGVLGPELTYSLSEIESRAREIQLQLWRGRRRAAFIDDPVALLDPQAALGLLGYQCTLEEGLGTFLGKGKPIEVAGLIDQSAKIVRLSRQFPKEVRLFTTAHELGHAPLHANKLVIHRDRSLDGATVARDPIEREADRFAAAFLMPAKLVRNRFKRNFVLDSFFLTDEIAYAAGGMSVQDFLSHYPTRRHIARLLASSELFNGRQLMSLAEQFRVSVETMAIRLEELKLVHDPYVSRG